MASAYPPSMFTLFPYGALRRATLLPLLAVVSLVAMAPVSLGAERIVRDVTFATVDGQPLQLDLYLADEPSAGLIVWVHGGAWRGGSRKGADLKGLTALGWSVASVDYRLSTVARFPAQIHDIKAAIRFLRSHASDYGYPGRPIVIAGSSAGAHLATVVGVSNGDVRLEGNVGEHANVSSDVQGTISLYGASNLTTILAQSTPHGLAMRKPALDLLLGGQPDLVPDLARLASPVFHVDPTDPPILIQHGDQDPQMPVNQSLELIGACEKHGVPAVLKIMHGSGHGGPAFVAPENLRMIDRFLREQLAKTQSK